MQNVVSWSPPGVVGRKQKHDKDEAKEKEGLTATDIYLDSQEKTFKFSFCLLVCHLFEYIRYL